MGASYVQTSFLGGEWSELTQGRMAEPAYKQGLTVCYNSFALEAGAWSRRPGTRFLAHTKAGAAGKIIPFDFSIVAPYQMEFTNGFVRFYSGLDLISVKGDADADVFVLDVSTATPAVVTLADTVPTAWANNDTIVFFMETVPCSAPLLCGRQFVMKAKSGATFTLYDALTGDPIDGSTIAFDNTGAGGDRVQKVFELATPYTSGTWDTLRAVGDIDNVLLLNVGFQPRKIVGGTSAIVPFAISAVDFEDGPYLDENTTTTTLALSAKTGSVTVTASSTTGINDGDGFQTTDIGRLIRWQAAPSAWNSGTTYKKAAIVLGSDNNIYSSLAGGNINHDPTTDNDSTYWEITSTQIKWTWLKITARTDTTHVTATIMGDDVPTTFAITGTTHWRLGLYSDTTGWPTNGSYHEGRLYLSGAASNRIDGSKSNDYFNFSPTDSDGTVADDNAVAAISNANDVNAIFWMISTTDGLIIGAQAGEWRIRASKLNDPITPTSIQFKRVSTYGCHDAEPVNAAQVVFIQRQQRKLMGHTQIEDEKYFGENLAITADHLTKGGIEQIAWAQEPAQIVWARRADGALLGMTFKKVTLSPYQKDLDDIWTQKAVGWHRHELGSGRLVTSIATGPTYDGLSQTLYLITNDPDTDYHYVEAMMPIFDDQQLDWANSYVDAGASPCCAKRMAIANGDSFDGLRVWGLWHLNGKTIVPVIGGLDCGDRVVSNGSIDIPFGTDPEAAFTLAFFLALDNAADYGIFQTDVNYIVAPSTDPVPPPVTTYSMTAHVGPDTTIVGSYNGHCAVDQYNDNLHDVVYQVQHVSGLVEAGIRKLNGPDGDPILDVTEASLGFTMSPSPVCYSPGHLVAGSPGSGFLLIWAGASNSKPLKRISTADLTTVDSVGNANAALAVNFSTGIIGAAVTSMCPARIDGRNEDGFEDYVFYSTATDASHRNQVVGIWIPQDGMAAIPITAVVDEQDADVCTGSMTSGTVYVIGHPRYGVSSTGHWGLYVIKIFALSSGLGGQVFRMDKVGTVAPSDVDATWTKFSGFSGVMYDAYDRNFIAWCQTDEAVTHNNYLVKFSHVDGSIVWKTAVDDFVGTEVKDAASAAVQPINGTTSFFHRTLIPPHAYIYHFDTTDGSYTQQEINPGHLATGRMYWQPATASLTMFGQYADTGSPDPVLVGDYLTNTNPPPFTQKWHRIFAGEPSAVPQPDHTELTEYAVPSTIGFTYTSRGQLLRPDYGIDAGPRNGPAFGKKRRVHWFSASTYRARKMRVGTDFTTMYPVKFQSAGGTPLAAPGLFTGIVSDTVSSDYSFDGRLAWEVTRPYNVTVTAMGGYIETQDK